MASVSEADFKTIAISDHAIRQVEIENCEEGGI
jgi:hypothetical protein